MTGYIGVPPVDPINHSPSNTPWNDLNGYVYAYGYIYNNGTTYDLTARLESPNDPDRCEVRHYTCTYGNRCPTSLNYQLYEFSPDSNSF